MTLFLSFIPSNYSCCSVDKRCSSVLCTKNSSPENVEILTRSHRGIIHTPQNTNKWNENALISDVLIDDSEGMIKQAKAAAFLEMTIMRVTAKLLRNGAKADTNSIKTTWSIYLTAIETLEIYAGGKNNTLMISLAVFMTVRPLPVSSSRLWNRYFGALESLETLLLTWLWTWFCTSTLVSLTPERCPIV